MFESIKGEKFRELLEKEKDNLEIIDVRDSDEHDLIKIKGSKHIPIPELMDRLEEIDWDKKVVFVCRSGSRSGYVAQSLAGAGKNVLNLEGGVFELNLDQCDCLEKSKDCCDGYL